MLPKQRGSVVSLRANGFSCGECRQSVQYTSLEAIRKGAHLQKYTPESKTWVLFHSLFTCVRISPIPNSPFFRWLHACSVKRWEWQARVKGTRTCRIKNYVSSYGVSPENQTFKCLIIVTYSFVMIKLGQSHTVAVVVRRISYLNHSLRRLNTSISAENVAFSNFQPATRCAGKGFGKL